MTDTSRTETARAADVPASSGDDDSGDDEAFEAPDATDDAGAVGPALLRVLSVRRNATVGAVAGVGLALLAYVFRALELVGPFPGTRAYPILGPGGWYLVLAFVLGITTAILVTIALTVWTAYRITRDL